MTRKEAAALDVLRQQLDALETDFQHRMTVVETEQKALIRKAEQTARQVGDMHDLLMKARGARWGVLTLIAAASTLAGLLAWFAARWQQLAGTLPN